VKRKVFLCNGFDTPPNSLKNPNVSPKMKEEQKKKKKKKKKELGHAP